MQGSHIAVAWFGSAQSPRSEHSFRSGPAQHRRPSSISLRSGTARSTSPKCHSNMSTFAFGGSTWKVGSSAPAPDRTRTDLPASAPEPVSGRSGRRRRPPFGTPFRRDFENRSGATRQTPPRPREPSADGRARPRSDRRSRMAAPKSLPHARRRLQESRRPGSGETARYSNSRTMPARKPISKPSSSSTCRHDNSRASISNQLAGAGG